MTAPSSVRRVTWRSADVARALGLGFLFLFLWKFFWLVHGAVFVTLLAVLIAIVLHRPAAWLARWMPYRLAFPLVLAAFLAGLGFLLVSIVPQLLTQAGQLATELPALLDAATQYLRTRTGRPPDPGLSAEMTKQAGEFVGRFVPLAFNAVTAALGSVVVLVLAVFLAAEPGLYRALLLGLVPPDHRDRWARVYDEAGENLRAWVIGKALTMLAVGVATTVGLELMGIPGALALGAFAALMEFIPNFGPTIAAIPAMLAAFAISPATAVYVGIFYFVLQQVQNAITVPLVERRAVKIPPAALLVWQLMLALGFGILALFVATPLLAVITVAIRILYQEPAAERREWDRREVPHPPAAQEGPRDA